MSTKACGPTHGPTKSLLAASKATRKGDFLQMFQWEQLLCRTPVPPVPTSSDAIQTLY